MNTLKIQRAMAGYESCLSLTLMVDHATSALSPLMPQSTS